VRKKKDFLGYSHRIGIFTFFKKREKIVIGPQNNKNIFAVEKVQWQKIYLCFDRVMKAELSWKAYMEIRKF
jgi:hypothetical protein